MSLTIALVEDAFLNGNRLEHYGFITGQEFLGLASSITQRDMMLSCEDENKYEFCVAKKEAAKDETQFFYCEERGILGWIFKEKRQTKVFTAFLTQHMGMYKENDAETLLKYVNSLGLKNRTRVTKTIEELKELFYSLGNRKLKKALTDQLVKNEKGLSWKKQTYMSSLKWYQVYFKAYVNFVAKYPITEDGCKKLIRNIDNLPKFCMETLDWDSPHCIYRVVADFLKFHFCGKPDCGGFSTKKCSVCQSIHYCSAECQREDFQRHETNCDYYKTAELARHGVPTLLKDILRMDPNREFNPDLGPRESFRRDLVSLEAFLKELMMKAYEAFHETLNQGEESLHTTLIYLLIKKSTAKNNLQYDIGKMGTMLGKGRKSEAFDKILKQMEEIHEKQNSEKIAEALKKVRVGEEVPVPIMSFTGSLMDWAECAAVKNPNFGEKDVERWLSKFIKEEKKEDISNEMNKIVIGVEVED